MKYYSYKLNNNLRIDTYPDTYTLGIIGYDKIEKTFTLGFLCFYLHYNHK